MLKDADARPLLTVVARTVRQKPQVIFLKAAMTFRIRSVTWRLRRETARITSPSGSMIQHTGDAVGSGLEVAIPGPTTLRARSAARRNVSRQGTRQHASFRRT
jgi:hypothetical protein